MSKLIDSDSSESPRPVAYPKAPDTQRLQISIWTKAEVKLNSQKYSRIIQARQSEQTDGNTAKFSDSFR